MKFKLSNILLYSLLVIFLIMDLYPEYGSPHFRYTGSDIDNTVLNLGYPLASLIIDFETAPYFFIGPSTIIIIPTQLFVLFVVWLIKILKESK